MCNKYQVFLFFGFCNENMHDLTDNYKTSDTKVKKNYSPGCFLSIECFDTKIID